MEKNGKIILKDNLSTNGTRVNEVEIEKEIELHDGDKVGVGLSLFECHFKEVD